MSKTKKIIIAFSSLILLIVVMITLYFIGLTRVNTLTNYVDFTIEKGMSKVEIVNELKNQNIIKSKYSTLIYLVTHPKIQLLSGKYYLNTNKNTVEILKDLSLGKIDERDNLIKITFLEGWRITDYAKSISDNFGLDEVEVLKKFEDKKFANSLVQKYDFLTDEVLNNKIYYPLEGYLFPDTYEFFKNSSIDGIIEKLVKETGVKLAKLNNLVNDSSYTIHEIITMASIVENEANDATDRSKVAQVIYTRLNKNMTLGMDVTTYYAVKKSLKEELTTKDLNSSNGYNTRHPNFIGLPVGPISSVSFESLSAVLNPADTEYIYFFADLKTGKVSFFKEYNDFNNFKTEQYKNR